MMCAVSAMLASDVQCVVLASDVCSECVVLVSDVCSECVVLVSDVCNVGK